MKETSESMYLKLPIPRGWNEHLFSELIVQIPTTKKKIKSKDYLPKGKYPVVDQGQEFISGYFNDATNVISEKKPIVLFGDHTKIVKYLDFPFVPGADGVKVFVPANEVEPRFLFFLTLYLSQVFPSKGYARHFHHVEKSKVALPNPNIQNLLSKKIDEYFKTIDVGDECLRKAKSDLVLLKLSILNSAIRGKLVPQDSKDEPSSILLERIQKEKEKLVAEKKIKKEISLEPLKEDDLPTDLPKGWTCVRLGDILSVGTGATPLKSNKAYYQNGKVPWLTSSVTSKPFVTEAEQFITKKALEETNCKLFPSGTLLVAMYGEGKTRGQVTEMTFEATTNQALAAILFDESTNILKNFVKIAFLERYEKIRMEAMGGNQPNLSTGKIKSQILPIPPVNEQIRIVEKVNEALEHIEKMSVMLDENLNRSEQLRQSILKKAFEGEL